MKIPLNIGIHYSYNKQLENDENFKKYIAKIENVLKLWRARNLSLEGKTTVFKSLALSKTPHLALVKTIPPSIIDQLNNTQKNFIWNGLNPKIKNSTINNNYENGGLKNVNIAAKISSLQSSWIKRLFDENFHDWKIIPLHIVHKSLGKMSVFHSNLKVNKKLTKSFPKYYREIINTWGSKFSCQTLVPSAILSQFLWFNSQVQIGNKSVFFSSFSERNINFVGKLFKTDGRVKPWKQLQEEYGLANKLKFKWIQIIHSLPKPWIEQIFIDSGNSINLAIQDHHLIKIHQILCLNKLDSKELYNIQLLANFLKPTSQAYFEKNLRAACF